MKILFEYTLNELVELQLLLMKRSKSIQSILLRNKIWSALLSAGLAFLACYFFSKQIVFSIIAALVAAAVTPLLNIDTTENRMRKICSETFECNPNHLCEFELTENGIVSRTENTQTLCEWSKIEEIKETQSTYFFFMQNLVGFCIQKRAFKTENEKDEFEALLQQYTGKFKK